MRQIDTDKFPGPALSALGTGQSAFRWWHGCSEASLLGIFRSGRVFRTCNETIGIKPTDTAYGFFGRAAYEGDDMVAAGLTSKLAFHTKNQCGVLVSGTLNCVIQNLHHRPRTNDGQSENRAPRCPGFIFCLQYVKPMMNSGDQSGMS